uniref:Uncharacterized protein n=1 Tax=Oryza brachyantha TaxID=4533 RepID=J3N8B7_ORYBR
MQYLLHLSYAQLQVGRLEEYLCLHARDVPFCCICFCPNSGFEIVAKDNNVVGYFIKQCTYENT